ncbi:zinc ribbon domain-containing protein [Thermodesulfobacteriota bacterium]
MECFQCGFDNKPGKTFCTECGVKLALKCPQCSSEIEAAEKFCGECGHNLSLSSKHPPKDLSFSIGNQTENYTSPWNEPF